MIDFDVPRDDGAKRPAITVATLDAMDRLPPSTRNTSDVIVGTRKFRWIWSRACWLDVTEGW
jgi:hypothetical protein